MRFESTAEESMRASRIATEGPPLAVSSGGLRRDLTEGKAGPGVLHIFPTFEQGGAQIRLTRIINGSGGSLHCGIMALDGRTGAAAQLRESAMLLPAPRKAKGWPQSLEIARVLRSVKPSLVVTYNWGAMDAVLGARIAAVCPLIHAEDGFGPDESASLKPRRILARRLLLRGAFKTVVPSRTLEAIAIHRFGLAPGKVAYIPNGVDTAKFLPGTFSEFRRQRTMTGDSLVFGYVGQLRKEKNLPLLLRAFSAASQPHWRLVLVGGGTCMTELKQLAADLGIARQVCFEGSVDDPAPFFRAFDVFVMSSDTEQMPIALLEAMASGLPAIITNVGDGPEMLGPPAVTTFPEVVPSGDSNGYARALGAMAAHQELRRELGKKNRARCLAEYTEQTMIQRYAQLYDHAIRSAHRKQ